MQRRRGRRLNGSGGGAAIKLADCDALRYAGVMIAFVPMTDVDEAEAESHALAAAIAESDADPRTVPHEEARAWLLGLASGDFNTPPPEPR